MMLALVLTALSVPTLTAENVTEARHRLQATTCDAAEFQAGATQVCTSSLHLIFTFIPNAVFYG
jgi:hypothetical protein